MMIQPNLHNASMTDVASSLRQIVALLNTMPLSDRVATLTILYERLERRLNQEPEIVEAEPEDRRHLKLVVNRR